MTQLNRAFGGYAVLTIVLAILVASVCFIQALKGLSHPTTSIRGNLFGMVGMTIAVLTTGALILKLAGGQTLINVMKARAASPDVLVDLADLGELKGIELGSDGTVEIGAMTTYSELIGSAEARARPILGEVCDQIADVQVRNRGTIGGNVCSNDPTNHFPPLLVALGASFTIRGTGGERTVAADDFFLGVYLTVVSPGELLTKISVPTPAPASGDGFAGISLGRHGTYIANAAATVGPQGVRVALGCVDAVPVRATALEQALAAGDYSEAAVTAAAAGLGAALQPPSDVHATDDYRRHLARVLTRRAVLAAAGG